MRILAAVRRNHRKRASHFDRAAGLTQDVRRPFCGVIPDEMQFRRRQDPAFNLKFAVSQTADDKIGRFVKPAAFGDHKPPSGTFADAERGIRRIANLCGSYCQNGIRSGTVSDIQRAEIGSSAVYIHVRRSGRVSYSRGVDRANGIFKVYPSVIQTQSSDIETRIGGKYQGIVPGQIPTAGI